MRFSLLVIGFFLFAQSTFADIVQYVDSSGKVHYVNDPSKVPEEYRDQLEKNPVLPPITRYEHRESKGDHEARRTLAYGAARKVEVFVTSWCGICKGLERYLGQKGVRYTRYDIEKNGAAYKTYQQLGGRGVPLVKIGSAVIRGFDASAIDAALRR